MGNLDLHQKVGTSKIDQMEEWRKSEQRAPQKLCEVQHTQGTGRETDCGERSGCLILSSFDWKSNFANYFIAIDQIFQYLNSIFKKKEENSANSVRWVHSGDKCPQDTGSVCHRHCPCGEHGMQEKVPILIAKLRYSNFLINSNDNHWDVMNIDS